MLLKRIPGCDIASLVDKGVAQLKPISCLIVACLICLLLSTSVAADPISLSKAKRISLNQKTKLPNKLPRIAGKSKQIEYSTPLHLQLKPDTFDEMLLLDQRHKKLERAYRHTSYLSLLSEFNQLDYRDESALARHAAAYQGMQVVSDYLKRSGLRDAYKVITDQMKVVKERTTVRVSKSASGDLSLGDGRSDQGEQLVQFRLRTSARHGPEARLELNDSWILRYELLNSTAMLEFSGDF